MSKKSTKALASATLMSLVLTTALSAGPVKAAASQVQPTRVSGDNRYATAAKVATTNWTTSDNVVLVSGEGYADAVSASALAKKLNAPILLTTSDTLSSDAQSALNTLKPKNVYVIGGTASISQSIRDGLKANYTLTELGGQNRYETNIAVAKELVTLGVSPSSVMVVGGQGFADALSVAPVAAAKGQILLLANNDQASSQGAIDFVKDNKSTATIVGTSNVISDAIKNAFGSTATRVNGGSSRFDTNLAVLKAFSSDLKADKLYVANASAADPDNLYADALVASAVAGKYTAPLVLVDKDGTDATNNAVAYIKSENAKEIDVIGGTSVVPDSIISEITGTTPVNPDPEVSSISSNGLAQVKIVFNQEVDSDTAEDVTNYKIDESSLKVDEANAKLQDDNKTVLLTLANKQKQNDNVKVTVKKGVLTADKSNTVPELSQTVTFTDTTAPTVDSNSVSVRGNNKLDIKFSEPLYIKGGSEATALNYIVSELKIKDKNLSSYGLNTSDQDGNGDMLSKIDNDVAVKDSAGTITGYYTDEVELYFDTALPTGSNPLKVCDDGDGLQDIVGFPITETTINFNVDTLTSAPKIDSMSASDNGKVYINFDRPMDTKTATKANNFTVNGVKVNKAELKKGDTQVKLSVSNLTKNANKVYVDDSVKDAYGNSIPDDTYQSVNLDEDTTKPDVSYVTALDDDTIRVKFTKDVDAKYATNTSNYTLKDGDGTDITNTVLGTNINANGTKKDSSDTNYEDNNAITIPGKAADYAMKDGDTTDIVDLHVSGKLTDSKYTLEINHVQDRASTPNVMDDKVITFDGSADVAAKAAAYKVNNGNDDTIAVVFNKAMDSSTLNNTANYEYVNAKGDTKPLPSDADITVSSDNKSVTIKLPSSLDVKASETDQDKLVTGLYATGVKDDNGKALTTGNNGGDLKTLIAGNTTVKDNSFTLAYDNNNTGDNLKAVLSFNNPIGDNDANRVVTKYTLAGEHPNSVSIDGDKITLTFNNDTKADAAAATDVDDSKNITTKINKIKEAGVNQSLTIDKSVTDVTGAALSSSSNVSVPVYSFNTAPKLIVNKDSNNNIVTTDTPATMHADAVANGLGITVTFDTPIDANSVKPADFTFSVGGTNVDATDKSVSGNTVTFIFEGSDLAKFKTAVAGSSSVNVSVKPSQNSVISTVKDAAGNYAYYKPSNDDLKTIYVTLASSVVDTAQVNEVAASLGTSFTATGATNSVVMPTVPSGYTIAVKTTSDATKYDATGKVLANGTSNVVYTVTNTATGQKADTAQIAVNVTAQ